MSLRLHYGSGSPYAWRVWLALEHKRVPFELKVISFSDGDTRKPEFLALNPRGQVPVLEDDDFALYESSAIVDYLEERFPERTVFPGDLRSRAIARRMMVEVDAYVSPVEATLVEEVLFKPEAAQDQAKIAEAMTRLRAELAHWETAIRGDFLAGQMSAADFTLYPILALLLRTERKRDIGVRAAIEASPRVESWRKRMEALPLVEKTVPPHWKT